MSNTYSPEPGSDQFIEKLNFFEQKHRPFINLIIKPLLTLLLFLSIGYYSMYMSTTYVKQDKFNEYVKVQSDDAKTRGLTDQLSNEKIMGKLEEILKNEAHYDSTLEYYGKTLTALHESDVKMSDRLFQDERLLFSIHPKDSSSNNN